MPTLSHHEARRLYDRIGARQDTQAFYEDRATDELVAHAGFDSARAVFEFGCGTGRFALRLLRTQLPPDAHYRGIDLSPTMVGLARARLLPFAARATIDLSEGGAPSAEPNHAFDRWVSTYVLDLLSDADIDAVLGEAYRMLASGGRLCLVGLSTGERRCSRAVARLWSWVHRRSPKLVGGCRPLELTAHLAVDRWRIVHHARMSPFCIPSEVVVAEPR